MLPESWMLLVAPTYLRFPLSCEAVPLPRKCSSIGSTVGSTPPFGIVAMAVVSVAAPCSASLPVPAEPPWVDMIPAAFIAEAGVSAP